MTYAFHWRKAITVSVCLHIFLLAAAGYLTAGLANFIPQTEEIILTLDLVNTPVEQAGSAPKLPDPSIPIPPDAPIPVMTEPPLMEPLEAKPVITTASALSMTAAEAPMPPVSGQLPSTSSAPSGSSGGKGIAAPGILSKVDPLYPPSARQAGLEGTVVLRIQILSNGRSGEIDIARSSGYQVLDEAAVAAVRQWHFIPAKDLSSSRPVTCTTTLPVSFRLHGSR